jgi:hypothetical protein
MIVQVLMLAYGDPGQVREVEIADDTPDEAVLDEVFKWGQNDFQPQRCCSVSVGDVIVLKTPMLEIGKIVPTENETPYLILSSGFCKLSAVGLALYCQLPRRDRPMLCMKMGAGKPGSEYFNNSVELLKLTMEGKYTDDLAT